MRYDNNRWCTNCTLMILSWLGVVNFMMELDGKKRDKFDSSWDERELMQLYRSNPSWTQPMIAIGVNKGLKGKEVKRNIISHVLEYSSDLGGSWQPQKAQSEKRSQPESALLAWFKQVFIFMLMLMLLSLYAFMFFCFMLVKITLWIFIMI